MVDSLSISHFPFEELGMRIGMGVSFRPFIASFYLRESSEFMRLTLFSMTYIRPGTQELHRFA